MTAVPFDKFFEHLVLFLGYVPTVLRKTQSLLHMSTVTATATLLHMRNNLLM